MAAKALLLLTSALALATALPALAQYQESGPKSLAGAARTATSDAALRAPVGSVELSAGAQHVSNDYGDWRNVTLRGSYGVRDHVLQGELAATREFGQSGNFLGLSDTVTFSPDWFGMLSAGAGDGAFYLPQLRVDAFLYRKWMERRSLVTSIGLGYYRAPDAHTDHSLSLGAAYYFTQAWIVEAGVRFNHSDPGSINSQQQFVAATYGKVGQDTIVARYDWGVEAYQAIAPGANLVDFASHQTSLSWRHWVNRQSGFLLAAEQYGNPSYQRQGANLGFFHQF